MPVYEDFLIGAQGIVFDNKELRNSLVKEIPHDICSTGAGHRDLCLVIERNIFFANKSHTVIIHKVRLVNANKLARRQTALNILKCLGYENRFCTLEFDGAIITLCNTMHNITKWNQMRTGRSVQYEPVVYQFDDQRLARGNLFLYLCALY
jgi:hypothetical protein